MLAKNCTARPPRSWWSGSTPILAIAAVWLLVVLLVDPRGDFPLNDDWCYAQAVQHLLREGEVRLTDWGSMALLTQVLWGAAFSIPRGFSFEALRASTLTLGLVALLCSYGTLRELRASRALAFVATLALLANPLFLLLSHTFMTDVPFLAFSTAALFLFVRGFERGSRGALAGALLLALAATFVRQLGLALLVGFAVASASRGRMSGRRWIFASAPLVGAFGLLRVYEAWLASRHSLPENYYLQWRTIRDSLSAGTLEIVGRWLATGLEMTIYLGLFVVPLAAMWMMRPADHGGSRNRLIVIAAATLGTVALASRGWLVPYFPNILLDIDCHTPRIVLGPLTLRDGCTSAAPGLGGLPFTTRSILTWLGMAGAGALVVAALETWTRARPEPGGRRCRPAITLLLATAGSYLALMALIHVFDRYLLFVVPFALAVLVGALRDDRAVARSFALGGALVVGTLLFSLGATQEYLDWNRARWRAIAYLRDDLGAQREHIDGGFEFGGWVNFDARLRDDRIESGWWVVDDRYVVSFAELRGYRVVARFPYHGWFGLTEDDVLALRRTRRGHRARTLAQ